MPLGKVRIVLVETTHPGNIGAAARAMRTMGLCRLYLVNPKRFPCAEATAMASGADKLLAQAKVCTSLAQAITGCQKVFGLSARSRSISWPVLNIRDSGPDITISINSASSGKIFEIFCGHSTKQ